ncbi:hypothetical protein CONCODRAFT_13910 [Conidiobolus coronatus NRRL 28638]|uniref:Uncharacterized protein n=1 Tax=Conidiobolus coronatus (strain ATCC 28846 / CBS 209.66 / NRRL 28638) TaxID=796925 RepID=A0A137NQ17_CONC2|nr:hypothetical protein CONCODRAFT_13910 [Conidiobolus coronatus NRRL 28638]|eukprot:KXN64800.1 hypothetical protein CONCODRAFT_13910 [Conidiobolus coronatus NRRL 28638]
MARYKNFLKTSDVPMTYAKDLATFFNTKEPEKPIKPTSIIYTFENFMLEKFLLEDKRKLIIVKGITNYYSFYFDTKPKKIRDNFIPSKTKFKVSFNPKDI